tara:strand:- start:233 stop:439 length:207 start_codon:yes stop_codon:yes gene_type:complete
MKNTITHKGINYKIFYTLTVKDLQGWADKTATEYIEKGIVAIHGVNTNSKDYTVCEYANGTFTDLLAI